MDQGQNTASGVNLQAFYISILQVQKATKLPT